MLNSLKKILISMVLSAGLIGIALGSQSTVTYVNINDMAYQDVEVVITDDAKILVPFKQLADIFNIKYSANRVDKLIDFETLDGKHGVINLNGIFVEDYPITDKKPIFLTQGIMDGVFNEAYIPSDVVEKIMDIRLETDYETLSLVAQVTRDIPLLANNNLILADDNNPRAYKDVVAPKKPKKITLNTIGLNVNMMNDNMKTQWRNRQDTNGTFNGTTQVSLNGNIMDGKYRVEATEYNYRQKPFMFGGVSFAYGNKFKIKSQDKTYWYELGKVKGHSDEDASIGTNIIGAQIWNYDHDKENPQDIHGYVEPTSMVRLTANNQEPVMLSTYSGYYTLKDVQLPNPVTSIKLEEVKEDGTTQIIREEKYNIFGNRPFEKENRYSAYAGVWGYQNRLFREGSNIYRGGNKKVTAGGYYQKGLKDNITFESKLTGDKIYEKSASQLMYRVPTNDTLLVTGTKKSSNYIEGATSLNSVEWQGKTKGIKARATGGVSIGHDIREESTNFGYMGKLAGEYEKDLDKFSWKIFKPRTFKAKLEAFHTSQDFYIASSDSTSKNDRTGGKAAASFAFNSTNIGGSYSRYYSNLGHKYRGGNIVFDEANANFSTKIPKVADVRLSGNYRQGENDLGRNRNYYYDANVSRNIGHWAFLQIGRRASSYDTHFHQETNEDRNYMSKYRDTYAQVDVPIPNNWGRFILGHNFVRYNTSTYNNGYNMFRFGYIFPSWKNWTLGLNWGLKYYGQTGNDLGATISHRSRSGQSFTVGYQYSKNTGYFIDNMFTPTTNRHTVSVTFNDAFQIFNHGLKSVSFEDMDKGIFEAFAYIDVNKNGTFDKKIDIPVKDIPITASWSNGDILTNKRGRVASASLPQGVYNVGLNMNELPITVSPINNDTISKKVRIDGGQTTRLEIPLASTVGSVSGTLKIFDDFERDLQITDFIVVILDQDGNEVNYSTVGSDGDFYISGLAPGNYTLQLDERFISAYGLEELADKSRINVVIPQDYYNPTDISDQVLEYKTYAL